MATGLERLAGLGVRELSADGNRSHAMASGGAELFQPRRGDNSEALLVCSCYSWELILSVPLLSLQCYLHLPNKCSLSVFPSSSTPWGEPFPPSDLQICSFHAPGHLHC